MIFIDEVLHTLGILFVFLLIAVCIALFCFKIEAAALIGKRFGSRHINLKAADHQKTCEGSAAMFTMAFAAVLLVLLSDGAALPHSLVTAAVSALAASFTEAVTKKGYDTVTVPFVTAVVIQIALSL